MGLKSEITLRTAWATHWASAGTDIGTLLEIILLMVLLIHLKDPDNVEKAEEAVESLLDKLQATLDEKKFYGQLSLEEEVGSVQGYSS